MAFIDGKWNNDWISNFESTNPSSNLRYIPNSLMTKSEWSWHALVGSSIDVQVRSADCCPGYLNDGIGLVDNGWPW